MGMSGTAAPVYCCKKTRQHRRPLQLAVKSGSKSHVSIDTRKFGTRINKKLKRKRGAGGKEPVRRFFSQSLASCPSSKLDYSEEIPNKK